MTQNKPILSAITIFIIITFFSGCFIPVDKRKNIPADLLAELQKADYYGSLYSTGQFNELMKNIKKDYWLAQEQQDKKKETICLYNLISIIYSKLNNYSLTKEYLAIFYNLKSKHDLETIFYQDTSLYTDFPLYGKNYSAKFPDYIQNYRYVTYVNLNDKISRINTEITRYISTPHYHTIPYHNNRESKFSSRERSVSDWRNIIAKCKRDLQRERPDQSIEELRALTYLLIGYIRINKQIELIPDDLNDFFNHWQTLTEKINFQEIDDSLNKLLLVLSYPQIEELIGFISTRFFNNNDYHNAIKYLTFNIAMLEKSRNTIIEEYDKITFFAKIKTSYDRLIQIYLSQKDYYQALTLIDHAKARIFYEKLLASTTKLPETGLKKLKKHDTKKLISLLTESNQTGLLVFYITLDKRYLYGIFASKGGRLLSYVLDYNKILKQVELLSDPEFIHQCYEEPKTSIKTVLSEENKKKLRFSNSPHIRDIKTKHSSSSQQTPKKGFNKLFTERCKKLYQLIIGPIDNELDGIKHLVIFPSGVLYRVPFAALHDGNNYLHEKCLTPIFPSLSILNTIYHNKASCQKSTKQKALFLGKSQFTTKGAADLPGVGEELSAIKNRIKIDSVFYQDNKADFNLLRENKDYDFYHLATHAKFEPSNPQNSFIILNKKNRDDLITFRQIESLSFTNSPVVYLSACETGKVKNYIGDEAIGLIRAFFVAGARTIIANQWEVEDNAAKIMAIAFYSNIADKSIGQAFQQAILQARQKYRNRPAFWATLTLYGMWY